MGGKVRCYYDGQRVLLETDDSNNDKRYFVFGNYIDEVLMMYDIGEDEDFYYGHDHLYSVVVIFDDDYDVYERMEYDAYGEINRFDPDFTVWSGTEINNPYYFTGRRRDTLDEGNFNIYYYRARYYDAETGRFLSRDPLGIDPAGGLFNQFDIRKQYGDGMNLYVIVNSNPVNALDPMGLWTERFPNPWKDPIDRVCDRYSGRKNKICKAFYRMIMCSTSAKVNACKTAGLACKANCGTDGEWMDSPYFGWCISYCVQKEAQCLAKAKAKK